MHAIIVVNVLTIRAGIHMRIKSCVNLKVKTNIILKFRYDVHSDWLKKLALLKYKTHSKSCHIICHQLYNIIIMYINLYSMFSNCLLNNFQVFMGHVNLGRFN